MRFSEGWSDDCAFGYVVSWRRPMVSAPDAHAFKSHVVASISLAEGGLVVMWAPEHEPKAIEKAKATRELRDEEGVIVVDDIRDMAPDQMTRAQIVRALRAYMVLPSSGELHDWYELLSAAKILLARETYEDGVGKKRCALCHSLRLLQ
jgi:hypothetical protein